MVFITPNQGARTFPEIKIIPSQDFFFFLNIGQVAPKFYLPHLNFHLPRASGQCLMLSPGLAQMEMLGPEETLHIFSVAISLFKVNRFY